MRTAIGLGLTAVVAIAATTAVLAARAYADRPVVEAVSPAPGAIVNGSTPIRIVLRAPDEARDVRVAIDGVDVTATATRTDHGLELAMPELADGEHVVEVQLRSADLLSRAAIVEERIAHRWAFATDRTAPTLELGGEGGWATTAAIQGRAEAGTRVTAQWEDGEVVTTAGADGAFALVPTVEEGETPMRVVAEDAAGNRTTREHVVRYDATAPELTMGGLRAWFRDSDRPTLYAFVGDASPTEIVAKVNGEVAKVEPLSIGYRIETGRLPQGRSTIAITVTDKTGGSATEEAEFGVDSTERLANNLTLMPGARGGDVVSLTRRLRLEGHWKGKASRVYDERVAKAVRAYQREVDLPVDGIARPALLQRTAGRVVVDKGDFTLTLFLDGKPAKRYPIAIGMPAYPTPTGEFVITDMLMNPTWTPPNSPWAAGLEPVPPGASNPLGTRWIGTSAPLIGIHGTPQDWSIGSMASHGCVRMHISDVEDLFERVAVGMPVEFRE
jgi:lipoprotein-anchoring transpeptidase ErfK/SrfK